ncbi:MAG TPA: hypothetical protein VLM37_04420 [Fibrobacteraceae bacterium]|nr:hypothetical protein [Fibrobacteraceae bacterium]
MNLKTGLLASILMNVLLVSLVFYVKHNITEQAQEAVKKKQEIAASQVKQAGEIFKNNNVLWDLVVSIYNLNDKSLTEITKLAKAARLPDRADEKAFLTITATSVDGAKARRIGWEKYSILLTFNAKDKLASLNVDDLLGKATPITADEATDGADSTAE